MGYDLEFEFKKSEIIDLKLCLLPFKLNFMAIGVVVGIQGHYTIGSLTKLK